MTISTERSVKAYCLMHDPETMNSDLGSHAQVVPFEGYEEVSTCMRGPTEPVEFPNPVQFNFTVYYLRSDKRIFPWLKKIGR